MKRFFCTLLIFTLMISMSVTFASCKGISESVTSPENLDTLDDSNFLKFLEHNKRTSELYTSDKKQLIINKIHDCSFNEFEQLSIINMHNGIYNIGLLGSPNLTFNSLLEIIKLKDVTGISKYQFESAIRESLVNKMQLTEDQETILAQLDDPLVIYSLLERENLSSEAFIELAKNCKSIPGYPIPKDFQTAVQKSLSTISLSEPQQKELVELDNPAFTWALLKYPKLNKNALLLMAKYDRSLMAANSDVKKALKKAADKFRIDPVTFEKYLN